ncbi:MAG TPA: hypothetical protein VJK51_00390 [Candidatus Nanoarchaeia archaeon]|nr:hypothetical protein [Candidatus Nanoarchaeia archaeon]
MDCKICGESDCKKHSFLLGKTQTIKEFSGNSPPEIFVGRWNYPNVYAGILAPQEYGDTSTLSSPSKWHEQQLPIPTIIQLRNKLIYSRGQTHIKQLNHQFLPVMQEIAMTHKSIAAEFKLKKPVEEHRERTSNAPLIKHAAELDKVRLQENPSIKPKVDYYASDTDIKSKDALIELQKHTETEQLVKILSAGLLGLRKNRKLVPTRWSITAVDDTLSKEKLTKIKLFPTIQEISLFNAEYLGNHYEFLLLPQTFSFEVIEISHKGGVWTDHETIFPRKTYADDVTGAYYANRLALTEYLEKIKRQATCLVFREIKPEYHTPLGVGILRQISREAFSKQPETFATFKEAIEKAQSRTLIPIQKYLNASTLLKTKNQQQTLSKFL